MHGKQSERQPAERRAGYAQRFSVVCQRRETERHEAFAAALGHQLERLDTILERHHILGSTSGEGRAASRSPTLRRGPMSASLRTKQLKETGHQQKENVPAMRRCTPSSGGPQSTSGGGRRPLAADTKTVRADVGTKTAVHCQESPSLRSSPPRTAVDMLLPKQLRGSFAGSRRPLVDACGVVSLQCPILLGHPPHRDKAQLLGERVQPPLSPQRRLQFPAGTPTPLAIAQHHHADPTLHQSQSLREAAYRLERDILILSAKKSMMEDEIKILQLVRDDAPSPSSMAVMRTPI